MNEALLPTSYLCRDCGHEGQEEDFGLHMACPKCQSHNIVRADLWRRYHETKKETGEDERANQSGAT